MTNIGASNDIIAMQNATAQYEASQPKVTGTTAMDSNTFLKLMMEQLKYQDPLSPVDNKDFIAQQAQFTQVSATQEMNKNIAQNNNIMQTLALVGKEVTLTDPDDSKKTITGMVSQAGFDSETSSITVNGKDYPLSLVKTVKEPSAQASTTN